MSYTSFAIICIIGMFVGGAMASYIFFGVLTLLGFAALVESTPLLRWFVRKTSRAIDIAIFILTIIATIKLGITITASLTVAGLGYTMVYAPYIRRTHKNKTINKRESLKNN